MAIASDKVSRELLTICTREFYYLHSYELSKTNKLKRLSTLHC